MLKITDFILLFFPLFLIGQNSQNASEYFKPSHHELRLMGNNVNSDGPDLAPFRYAAKLFYSTLERNEETGGSMSRIYTLLDGGQVRPSEINPTDKKNNIAHTCLTKSGSRAYFTLYSYDENEKIDRSQICFRDREYDGRWGPIQRLPKFGSKKMLASQPAIGIFRQSRAEVLFFVADRPGGKGKLDIWACYVERDGSFSNPFNLPINTPEDDMCPFFDVVSQTLFFSSKGHSSLGGFDVFRTQLTREEKWAEPENIGRPINSYHDDLFFTFYDNGKYCYFSTDRPNHTCPKNEPACRDFDIYQIGLKATVQVFLFDEYDYAHLDGCNLELKDVESGKILTTYINLENNYASVGLEPGKEYQIIISKLGYHPVFKNIRADERDFFKPGFLEIHLRPMGPQAMKVTHKPVLTNDKIDGQTYAKTMNVLPKQSKTVVEESIDTTIIAYSELIKDEAMTSSSSEHSLDKEKKSSLEKPSQKLRKGESISEPKIDKVKGNEIVASKESDKISNAKSSQELTPPELAKNKTLPIVEQKTEYERQPAVIEVENNEVRQNYTSRKESEVAKELRSNNIYIEDVKNHFLSIGRADFLLMTNMPKISLGKDEDPVDLLFSHKDLQCLVVFDFKNKDFQPNSMETMSRYLKSIDGLLKEDQRAPIGISFFRGKESKFVVYSFWDSNAITEESSFVHTFLFPEHYQGILPNPAALIKLLE